MEPNEDNRLLTHFGPKGGYSDHDRVIRVGFERARYMSDQVSVPAPIQPCTRVRKR